MAQTLKTFSKTVTVAGTAEPLSATKLFTTAFCIRAKLNNGGNLYTGDLTVDSNNGMFLQPGETNEKAAQPVTRGTLQTFDISKIYIDADVSGDGAIVEYLAEEP